MIDAARAAPAGTPPPVAGGARVSLHQLSMRADGDSWVIGRVDTGDFAVMPPVAHRAIVLLGSGHTVGEVAQALRAETGTDIAVADFVASLDELGFVAAIDGQARRGPAPVRPSLPWLRPRHVLWLLHPVWPWLVLAITGGAIAAMAADPWAVPRYRDLAWGPHAGLVLGVDAAIAWALVLLHELAHLATARAAGVPARMSLSTRLQFLGAQTDVSGVWAAPRRTRLTVYLSGMAVNVAIAAVCVLAVTATHPAGLARSLPGAVAVESVLSLPLQLLIFMRTDVYFVVQDLAGCANLYADGSARLRYLARRMWHALRRSGHRPPDPARGLGRRERRAVRAYSWLLLTGTAATLGMAAAITVPAAVMLLARAVRELAGPPVGQADGMAALIVTGGFQIVWLRTWWQRHGSRIRGWVRTRFQRQPGRG